MSAHVNTYKFFCGYNCVSLCTILLKSAYTPLVHYIFVIRFKIPLDDILIKLDVVILINVILLKFNNYFIKIMFIKMFHLILKFI